jgi:SAM-dependent methyltransferase
MADEDRYGYKWDMIKNIPREGIVQFRRWLNIDDKGISKIFEGKTVFDAGCGIATNSYIVLDGGAKKVTAVDAFQNTVRLARKNLAGFGDRAEVKVLNLEKDKISGEYDIVMCLGVLMALRNPREVLEKLLAATKKDGKLFVWVYGRSNHALRIEVMDNIRKVSSVLPMFINKPLAHCMSIPAYALTKVLPGAYFEQLSGFGYPHFYSIILDQMLANTIDYYTKEEMDELIKGLPLKYEKDTNRVGWLITKK